jgi:CPA2 family monovalent cation:H+ antiporter-2
MEGYEFVTTLVAAIVLAFFFGFIAQRLKLSPIFGYLMAGLACGPNTPGVHADLKLALEMSEIGVILLMFGVGLKISLDDMWSVRGVAIPCALIHTILAAGLGYGAGMAFGLGPGESAVLGAAISITSTIVLLRALEERKLLKTEEGRISVSWLLIQDLLIVLAIVILPAIAWATSADGAGISIWRILGAVAVTFAKIGAFVAFMLIVGARVFPWLIIQIAHAKSRELLSLGTLALALGVAYVAFRWFDASFALGAFLAGLALNGSKFSHKVAEDSLPLRDTFAVLFFVAVGMLFDPGVILRQPIALAALVAVIIFGKGLAAYALMKAYGQPHKASLLAAIGLGQIGEFSFVLTALGRSLNLVSQETNNLILAAALISIAVNPFLFRIFADAPIKPTPIEPNVKAAA